MKIKKLYNTIVKDTHSVYRKLNRQSGRTSIHSSEEEFKKDRKRSGRSLSVWNLPSGRYIEKNREGTFLLEITRFGFQKRSEIL